MLTFNTDNMVHQRFGAFPAPIMDYLLKELKPEHLLKLYQCCKFFYHKYRLNIIRHLEIVDDGKPEVLDPFKSVICISNPVLEKIKDFWITDSFFYNAPSNLTQLMPEFNHCTVKKLVARGFLLWKEFEALAKAGTIEELKIGYVDYDVFDRVSFDEIIGKVPDATSIELSETFISSTTFDTLLALDHKAKISTFILHNITPFFDNHKLNLLIEFLYKVAADDCKIHVDFKLRREINDDVRQDNETKKELGNLFNQIIALKLQLKKFELEFAAREV